MKVTLTEDQEKFVAEQLKTGHYGSPADVVAKSLGMLRAQEEFIRSNAASLRKKVAAGMEQARRGEVVDGKKAIQNLRKKLHQLAHSGR
jgi:putative addiction module CopG family antidote